MKTEITFVFVLREVRTGLFKHTDGEYKILSVNGERSEGIAKFESKEAASLSAGEVECSVVRIKKKGTEEE